MHIPSCAGVERTILVVEDQAELRLLIRLALKPLGRVLLASNAAQGLELVSKERPDLVVLDVWLGQGCSGLDVCAAIRSGKDSHTTRVLMLSACGQQSDIEAGLKAGADRYMIKPFLPKDLSGAVAGLLASGQ
jgi:DNA-binding response OmpR family regulator